MYVYRQIVVNEEGNDATIKDRLKQAGNKLKSAGTVEDLGTRAAAGAALGGIGNMAIGTVKHRMDLRKLKRSGASDATIVAYKRLAHRDTLRRGVGGAVKGAAVGAAAHYTPTIAKGTKGRLSRINFSKEYDDDVEDIF